MTSTFHALRRSAAICASLALAAGGCAPAPIEVFDDVLAGGDTTVFDESRAAYSFSARNLSAEERGDFSVGDNLFGDNWVIAPSSTSARDGLGPVYNALSCGSCHFHDGRGRPPTDDEGEMLSMLVRLSVPGVDPHGGPLGEPTYGGQLQPRSILDVPSEGGTTVHWTETTGVYADGSMYSLREPTLAFRGLGFGPIDPAVLTSMRVAPAVYGLGLLEVVPEDVIVARADPDDIDGDGISGRANRVWDVALGASVLGRFGWKANQPNLRQQTAAAFLGDIGITSTLFPDPECGPSQAACASARNGGAPELDDRLLDFVVFYGRTLAVPARRNADDPEVERGRLLFIELRCANCHTPTMVTGYADIDALSSQRIWPYTDLLLHDMGEGLADGRPDYLASGSEWRTPPLWGIGLLQTVNRHELLMHDGRARGFAEAILWHGGEGEAAREAFRESDASARQDLLRFLESL
jgi:CxxC motif-containing protein (DUF1111 family)